MRSEVLRQNNVSALSIRLLYFIFAVFFCARSISEVLFSPCISVFIPLHEKFLQFDWLRAVVFQLNLKYLHVKVTNLLRVVV